MLAPLFFLTMFFAAQLGLYTYYQACLNYATDRAARQILTGAVANAPAVNLSTFLSNDLCPNLPSFMSCANVVVNSKTVTTEELADGASSWWQFMNSSYTGLADPPMDNTKTSFCIGTGGSVVALEVFYAMPVIGVPSSIMPTVSFQGRPVLFLTSTAAFKNEPFTTTYSGC